MSKKKLLANCLSIGKTLFSDRLREVKGKMFHVGLERRRCKRFRCESIARVSRYEVSMSYLKGHEAQCYLIFPTAMSSRGHITATMTMNQCIKGTERTFKVKSERERRLTNRSSRVCTHFNVLWKKHTTLKIIADALSILAVNRHKCTHTIFFKETCVYERTTVTGNDRYKDIKTLLFLSVSHLKDDKHLTIAMFATQQKCAVY